MALKLTNNAVALLAAGVSDTDTTIAVTPGAGDLFPTLGPDDWAPLTLVKSDGTLEIVRMTARSGDTMTIVRAQDGTPARAFSAGDRVEHRMTAGVYNQIIADILNRLPLSGGELAGDLTVYRSGNPATGAVFLGNGGNHYLHFDGSNYLLPGGHLYVNGASVWTTANFNPAAYLPLGGGTISGNVTLQNTAPTIVFSDTDWGARQLHCNSGLIGFLNTGGGWACYSSNDGSFIATGNIGAYSDRKHKAEITTITSALELVGKLRGVFYVDKRTGARRVGVVAQEVQEVLPEVVGEGPDGLHVDYGNIVGPLIEAVKELAAEVRMIKRGL